MADGALVEIERRPIKPSGGIRPISIKTSLPFVTGGPGLYVHRVRSATFHQYDNKMRGRVDTWIGVRCWCGMVLCISERGCRGKSGPGSFLAEPSADRVVCATCEGRAIGSGLFGSPVIAGRPVKFSPRVGA